MNNGLIEELKTPSENNEQYMERSTTVIKKIEAIDAVLKTREWGVLRQEIFDGVLENLERLLKLESEKREIDSAEMYRLQGQIAWARVYTDLTKLSNKLKDELVNIKKNLKHE